MSAAHHHAFLDALADAGLAMHKPALEADGSLHRYRVEGDKSGSTNGWYVLHLTDKPFGLSAVGKQANPAPGRQKSRNR